jgi:hemoglobin
MENFNQENIFSRIGGIESLHNIVDLFYDKVLADSRVNFFFQNSDMNIQRGKMKAFLMMALGGPVKFTGRDMRHAHTHLVTAGLNDNHFSIVGGYLHDALEANKVDAQIINEVDRIFESVRGEVLNR